MPHHGVYGVQHLVRVDKPVTSHNWTLHLDAVRVRTPADRYRRTNRTYIDHSELERKKCLKGSPNYLTDHFLNNYSSNNRYLGSASPNSPRKYLGSSSYNNPGKYLGSSSYSNPGKYMVNSSSLGKYLASSNLNSPKRYLKYLTALTGTSLDNTPKKVMPNWTDRYLRSGHHTDRHVREIVKFEKTTGIPYNFYPEYIRKPRRSMARGRSGSAYDSGVVVVSTIPARRRFYDDTDIDLISPTKRAQLLTDFTLEDHDALRSASRRHDRELLGDITSRLVSPYYVPYVDRSLYQPRSVIVTPRHVRASSVPPSFSPGEERVVVKHDVSAYPTYRRRWLYPSHYYDVPYTPYSLFPSYPTSYPSYPTWAAYHAQRHVRAGSEPPVLRSSSRHRPAEVASTDFAVRKAHHYLNKLESELGVGTSFEDEVYVPPPQYRYYRPLVVSSRPWSRAPLPLPPVPRTPRTYGFPYRSGRTYEIEARLASEALDLPEPASWYSTLRSRANKARDKMGTHRLLLDRYLPVYMGPVNEVEYEVEHKYGELAARMPTLEPYNRGKYYHADTREFSKVAPYRPAPISAKKVSEYATTPLRPTRSDTQPAFPPVSDTRKRAREVLCKTKGDPFYYSY